MKVKTRGVPLRIVGGSQLGSPVQVDVDIAALERDLKATVEGEVRFDAGSRGMWAHDASNYRMVPLGVVLPKSKADVAAAMAAARRHGAPVITRGGGTAIPGQGVNVALMIDFSKYLDHVLDIDTERRVGRVEPGCILDTLRNAATQHGLTFGPDPATHDRNTLGGMIGNDSCGIHSIMSGRTSDNIESLEILLYDGTRMTVGATDEHEFDRIVSQGGRPAEIYIRLRDLRDRYATLIRERYPQIPRRVSGYNLDSLLPENDFHVARALVGSEGTCVTVLEAACKLIHNPPVRSLLVLGFDDVGSAGDAVPECLKYKPIGLEGMDDRFIEDMKLKGMHPKNLDMMPDGRAWLLVEFGGESKEDSDGQAQKLIADLNGSRPTKLFDDPAQEKLLWNLREEGLGATAHVPGQKDNHEGWEDTAVSPAQVGAYLRDFQAMMEKYGYQGSLYGHFGDGCIHVRLDFDLQTKKGIERYRAFVEEGADLVARYHGSISGEHGDGQAKGELLEKMFGTELIEAFKEFKQIWDPDWKMNPGKLVAPYRLDENLTLGTDYNPPEPQTHFKYPADHKSFASATRRCVGAGVCRHTDGGTMCPSYMVTHEEKHCTRGRARMLYEMLEGDPVRGGWKSEEVRDALDLCMSCKGCKGDCPVQVDMATYKAEFLSHYYKGRFRPRHAYAFGLIRKWTRLAAQVPLIVNFLTHAPGLAQVAKWAAGIDPRRRVPSFAPYTFKEWFRRRRGGRVHGRRVILWPDTFNDHFHPTTAQAAVEVLEAADCSVKVPMQEMCCGRPLYDYGMLDIAKSWLLHILDVLREDIRAGTPVVVLEPSCAAVFRDELVNLFPDDEDAKRLQSQTYLLSEFLEQECPDFKVPPLKRKALLHGHCHHKAIMRLTDEESVVKKMGLDYEAPDTGCCGMAGAFGFEAGEHYDVAIKCGERVLLPAVRSVDSETLIIADGFSCREQIAQTTDREAIHLAQALKLALDHAPVRPYPERALVKAPVPARQVVKTVAVLGAAALLVGYLVRSRARQPH